MNVLSNYVSHIIDASALSTVLIIVNYVLITVFLKKNMFKSTRKLRFLEDHCRFFIVDIYK